MYKGSEWREEDGDGHVPGEGRGDRNLLLKTSRNASTTKAMEMKRAKISSVDLRTFSILLEMDKVEAGMIISVRRRHVTRQSSCHREEQEQEEEGKEYMEKNVGRISKAE